MQWPQYLLKRQMAAGRLAASQTIPRPERLVEATARPVHRPFRTNSMGRVTRHWRVWLISEVASRQTPFAHGKGRKNIIPQKSSLRMATVFIETPNGSTAGLKAKENCGRKLAPPPALFPHSTSTPLERPAGGGPPGPDKAQYLKNKVANTTSERGSIPATGRM